MNHYEAKGIAAMLPAMLRVLECMDEEVDRMLLLVNGRPLKVDPRDEAAIRTWENVTKKQQKARIEAMKRGRQQGRTFIKDMSRSEEHRKNLSEAATRTWENMTKKQQKARIEAMKRGRQQGKLYRRVEVRKARTA